MGNEDNMYYAPPPKRSAVETFSTFLWNSETKQFLGRTAGSWVKILVFYITFYTVLSIFWGILWLIFSRLLLNSHTPRFMLKESLIGSNPGLGYRPMPSSDFVDSSLIWFRTSEDNFIQWTHQIDNFLQPYKNISIRYESNDPQVNVARCDYKNPAPHNKSCLVETDKLHPCNSGFYNYDKGTPCIFLKLNKIFNWIPEYYNNTDDLPRNLPKGLRDNIAEKAKKSVEKLNTVWVSCEGENAADKEHIGSINMIPEVGFPGYYFPYSNTKNYLSPLVAVWFTNPTRGVLINIECKAWAKNIFYDRHDRRGSVHFEIMVDY